MQPTPPQFTNQHLFNPQPLGARLPISPLLHQQSLLSSQQDIELSIYKDTMKRNHVIILVLLTFVLGLLIVWAIALKATHREIQHETKVRVQREDLESQLEEEESRR
ncbi:hypothetical protein C1H76_4739 [Elsinoe australis]|uniref:Uncharacterized protein n=1 Tax=Elsinoe australis TaxID=40998 RepID=A0A4U7B1U7_9PEZI|nr:hypothetical protein C1H76_4739 [Elsinoe australis]